MTYYGENSFPAMGAREKHDGTIKTFDKHQHHHLEMIFVEEGEYYFSTPAGKQKYQPGDVFIANSEEDHWCDDGPTGEYFYLQLSLRQAPRGLSNQLDRFLEELTQKKILLMNRIPRELAAETGLFRAGQAVLQASRAAEGVNELKLIVAALQVFQILEEYRLYTVPGLQSELLDPLVQKISAYLDVHYAEDLTLEEMARVCGYDKHYFCNLFRKHFGCSFTRYLRAVRLKKFMSHPKLNQQTIAFCAADVGFQNYSYFYTVFCKSMSCSPREYLINRGERENYGQYNK